MYMAQNLRNMVKLCASAPIYCPICDFPYRAFLRLKSARDYENGYPVKRFETKETRRSSARA